MKAKINLQQLTLMKHAIGFDRTKVKRGKYIAWRNYFCSYGECPDWEQLFKLGLATKREPDKQGAIYYFVSDEGIELLSGVLEVKIVEDD